MPDFQHLLGLNTIVLRSELLALECRRGASRSAAYGRIAAAARDGHLLPVGGGVFIDVSRFQRTPVDERWEVAAAATTLATSGGVLAGAWGSLAHRTRADGVARAPIAPMLVVRDTGEHTPADGTRGTTVGFGYRIVRDRRLVRAASAVVQLAGRSIPVLDPVHCALSAMRHVRVCGGWEVVSRDAAPTRFELEPTALALAARDLGADVCAKRMFRAWSERGPASPILTDTMAARRHLSSQAAPLVPGRPRSGTVDVFDLILN